MNVCMGVCGFILTSGFFFVFKEKLDMLHLNCTRTTAFFVRFKLADMFSLRQKSIYFCSFKVLLPTENWKQDRCDGG